MGVQYESCGIQDTDHSLCDQIVDKIEIVNGRYQVELSFKEEHQLLPDNFQVAKARLTNVLKRLKSNPPLLSQYQHVIEDQWFQGIIEEVVEPIKSYAG